MESDRHSWGVTSSRWSPIRLRSHVLSLESDSLFHLAHGADCSDATEAVVTTTIQPHSFHVRQMCLTVDAEISLRTRGVIHGRPPSTRDIGVTDCNSSRTRSLSREPTAENHLAHGVSPVSRLREIISHTGTLRSCPANHAVAEPSNGELDWSCGPQVVVGAFALLTVSDPRSVLEFPARQRGVRRCPLVASRSE